MPYSQLYFYYCAAYLPCLVLNAIILAALNDRVYRLHHLWDFSGIFIFALLIILLLILGHLICLGFYVIIHRGKLSNLQTKIVLTLYGTYWYNLFLIPISILHLIAKGYTVNGLAIIILGPMLFLIPSLALVWACHRVKNSHP